MEMDAGEICRSYAAAKDKNDQIKVLADLNDCSTQEILDVLTGGGMISGVPPVSAEKPATKPKKRLPTVRWTAEDERELIRMYEAGVSSIEMAEKLGREQKQVWDKVHYLRKKGYIFTPDKPDKQPKADAVDLPKVCEGSAPELPAGEPKEPDGLSPLCMLFDSLPPGLDIRSAAVRFMDEQGKCWHMELTSIQE